MAKRPAPTHPDERLLTFREYLAVVPIGRDALLGALARREVPGAQQIGKQWFIPHPLSRFAGSAR
jgi:hypothetical protein